MGRGQERALAVIVGLGIGIFVVIMLTWQFSGALKPAERLWR